MLPILLRYVLITLSVLPFVWSSEPAVEAQEGDVEVLKEDELGRHPLAALVGPHYEHYWSKIPFFYVGEGLEKCFFEFVPADINLVVPYYGNKTEQGYVCYIQIEDLQETILAKETMTPQSPVGIIHYKSPMSAQYKICALCAKSSWMSRTQAAIALKIELVSEMNTVFNSFPNEAVYEKNDSSSYQVVNRNLKEAQAELEVAIELEFQELMKQSGTFSQVETMKFRIWVMALITLGCSGLIMIAVVKYLRNFFRREKVI